MSKTTELIAAAIGAADFHGDNIKFLQEPVAAAIEEINIIEQTADAVAEKLTKTGMYTSGHVAEKRKEAITLQRESVTNDVLNPLSQVFQRAESQFEGGNLAIYFPKSSSDDVTVQQIGASEKMRADQVFDSGQTDDQIVELIKSAVKNNEVDFASRLTERARIAYFKFPVIQRRTKQGQIDEKIHTLNTMITESLSPESKAAVTKFKKTAAEFRKMHVDFKAMEQVFAGGRNAYLSEKMIEEFDASKFTNTEALGRYHSAVVASKRARSALMEGLNEN